MIELDRFDALYNCRPFDRRQEGVINGPNTSNRHNILGSLSVVQKN